MNEARNLCIGVHDVVKLLREIAANLLDKGENMIAHFVLAVLLLVENGQCCEDDAFQELEKNFISLSVDQVEGLENVFVLNIILTQREVRNEDRQNVFERNETAVDKDESTEGSADIVENSAVTFLSDQARERVENLRICSGRELMIMNKLEKCKFIQLT